VPKSNLDMIRDLYICNSAFVFDPHDVCESTFIMFRRGDMESFRLLMWCVYADLESRVIQEF